MKPKSLLITTCLVVFTLIFLVQQLQAVAVLFVRPRWSQQEYDKMWIKTVSVDVDIQDQIAVTHVDQVFYNEMNTSVEAIYIFPLPENAMITELIYWVNGQRFKADIREREEARKEYDQKLRQWLDPALLEYLGDNLFRLSIVPINAHSDVRTEITYVELLNYDFGKVHYQFLLNTLELSPKPLQTVSLVVDAKAQSSFKEFKSPSHQSSTATKIEKISDKHYQIMFGDENFFPDKDFTLEFETVRDEVKFDVLTYTPTEEDSFGTDSFYALWITPPDSLENEEIIPKDIIFTADVSSSMEGTRIQQLKEALDFFIELLNPIDRFNIITFGTFVEKFKSDLVPAASENITQAHEFVFQMYALGMTNIDEAIKASLNQSFGDTTSNNLIFLTDGNPTYGETHIDVIVSNAVERNTRNVRLFTFGVGDNLSRPLLINLARQNHGYPTFITTDDSIALIVNNHFTRISKPVLTDLQIDFGGLQQWDRYPKIIQDLFWGNQILQLGLYSNSGTFDVTLLGKIRSHTIQFMQQTAFTDTVGGHRFVPRLWAKAKIDNLLELIEIYGETQELVNQVIELSLRFQILTPYTAFYSDPNPTDVKEKDLMEKPDDFELYHNYPNPFNPNTDIKYVIPKGKASYQVVIKIYDALGRLVKVLVNKRHSPGTYAVSWNGTDTSGKLVASGVYFYTLEVGNFKLTKKMLLLR